MGERIQTELSTLWARRALDRTSHNDGVAVACALLDSPDPRAMGSSPSWSRSERNCVRAVSLGPKTMTAWELETLFANGHARKIEQRLSVDAVGPLCAAWVGSEFARRCEEADAPDVPCDRRSMIRVSGLGRYVIDTATAVFAALDGWFRKAFIAAIERRSRDVAELLSWVDPPSRKNPRCALSVRSEAQRGRELAWWARLELDAGRGELDQAAMLRRVDAACGGGGLDWHPATAGPWPLIALAARCAQRLAPDRSVAQDPANISVARAIRIARDAAIRGEPANHREVESTRRALLDQVHRPWQEARISAHVLPYALHAVESALFGAERASDDTHLHQALLSMRGGIAEIAYPDITWLPLPALWAHFAARTDRAVHEDIQWLSRWSSGDGVTTAFFERELWPEGPPLAWGDHVEQFRGRLFPPKGSAVLEQ